MGRVRAGLTLERSVAAVAALLPLSCRLLSGFGEGEGEGAWGALFGRREGREEREGKKEERARKKRG